MQKGRIPCPLYIQTTKTSAATVKEARCYINRRGQGNKECQNHCLPLDLGSVYFVTFILFCGYMLVNVAISIVIEKMMEKEDDDEKPERLYRVVGIPNDKELIILVGSPEERDHIFSDPMEDRQHDHYALEGQEIWPFHVDGVPSVDKFPPIAITGVRKPGTEPGSE